MTIHEKKFEKLKQLEAQTKDLIQELETEKFTKREIDKIRLILTKTQSAKALFNDK